MKVQVVLALAVIAILAFTAVAETQPIPSSFEKPLIDNGLHNPRAQEDLKIVQKIIAKEPASAALEKEKPLNEFVDDDGTPEGKRLKQVHILKAEIRSLKKLIKQGKKIAKVLPVKQKRLKKLKTQLYKINGKAIKEEAAEKLERQKILLKKVAAQEKEISKKLNALKSTQKKLNTNMKRVADIAAGKIKPDEKKRAAKKAAKAKAKAAKKADAKSARFQQVDLEAEVASEQELSVETEDEKKQEASFEAEVQAAMD